MPRSERPQVTSSLVECPKPAEAQHKERTAKQDRILTLLIRPQRASIAEMMQAIN
jgi:hypothetical protein